MREVELKRNNSIDLFRFVAAMTVIMSHSKVFIETSNSLFFIVAEFIPRYTVPFFLCTSGYFMIKSMLDGKKVVKKTLRVVLTVYLLWTGVYYLASFVENIILSNKPIGVFLIERVIFFFTIGSYPHFWYFTALIYTIITIAIVNKLWGRKGIKWFAIISLILNMLAALGTAYYEIGNNIPILSIIYNWEYFGLMRDIVCMGFAFFSLGYFIIVLEEKIKAISIKKINSLLAIAVLIYLFEIIILVVVLKWTDHFELIFSTYWLTGIVFAKLLKHPMEKYLKVATYARKIANLSFYIHPLLIILFVYAFNYFGIHVNSILFFVLIAMTIITIGYFLIKKDSKLLSIMLGENAKKNYNRKLITSERKIKKVKK